MNKCVVPRQSVAETVYDGIERDSCRLSAWSFKASSSYLGAARRIVDDLLQFAVVIFDLVTMSGIDHKCRLFILWRRSLVEHLTEVHQNSWLSFDEILELLHNRIQWVDAYFFGSPQRGKVCGEKTRDISIMFQLMHVQVDIGNSWQVAMLSDIGQDLTGIGMTTAK